MKRVFLMKIVMTLLVIFVISVSPVLAMSYSYDDLGRLTSVTYDSGQTSTYSYDSAGNMLSCSTSLGNNLITSYSLPAEKEPALIDNVNHTITIMVISGTDVTNMAAEFTLSDGAIAQVGSTTQVSNITTNDFSTPVIYKIIAADGSEQDWAVTVTVANSANQITAYSLAEQTETALIDSANHTVTETVSNETDVTNLIATFTLSEGATMQVGNIAQNSGVTANDFTNPVIYKVIAADGSEQEWTVIVTVEVPAETIFQIFTVSNTTSSGLTVTLTPALDGLTTDNFALVNGSGNSITITNAVTTDNGAIYDISAMLSTDQTYTITITKSGYDFGLPQIVTIPEAAISATLTVNNTTLSGFTMSLSPALAGLTTDNFSLLDSSGSPVTITDATTTDNGATYDISVTLSTDQTYTVTVTKNGYDFGSPQTMVVTN